MTVRRSRLVLPLTLIGLSLMTVSLAATPHAEPTVTYRGDPRILTPGLPSDWTVVLEESGYESFPDAESTSRRCPEIVVLKDETIIWRVNQRGRFQSRSFDPESWRIGRVDRAALARLHRLVDTQRFFLTPAEKLASRESPFSHGITTTLALKVAGKAKVLSVYSLDYQTDGVAAEPFARGYAAIVNAIRALRPDESRRYEPELIRVERHPDHISKGKGAAVAWPATRIPERDWRMPPDYFSGSEAKDIISALSKSYRVSFKDKEYVVAWAPAFSLPRDPQLLQPVSARSTGVAFNGEASFRPNSSDAVLETGRRPGEVTRISPGTKQPALTWRAHPDAPVGMSWHPGGQILATGAGGDAVRLWKLPNVTTPLFVERSARVRRMAWSPSGALLAGLHDGKEVRVWRADGAFVRSLSSGIEPVCLAWSPTGGQLAVGENDGSVRMWDTGTWKPLSQVSTILHGDPTKQPFGLSWNRDGNRLAFFRNGLEMLHTRTGKLSRLDPTPIESGPLMWSSDGRMLATAGWQANCVWRLGRRTEKLTFDGGARALTWVGPTKLIGLREGQLLTWDLSLGRWEPVPARWTRRTRVR